MTRSQRALAVALVAAVALGAATPASAQTPNLLAQGSHSPAVADLQQIFIEDWDFASGEHLSDVKYYEATSHAGPYALRGSLLPA